MSRADEDLEHEVAVALADAYPCTANELARAAIEAVRRHDAAKVIPFRRPGAAVLTPGWEDQRKAAQHSEGPR